MSVIINPPEKEEWRKIKGYDYFYISNLARVKSIDRTITDELGRKRRIKGQFLTPHYNKRNNIYEVHIMQNGKRKCHKLYRLVAEAFCENDDPEHKTTVNHKDGDRSHNYSTNLEWTTYSENLQHAYDTLHRTVNKAYKQYKHCYSVNKLNGERKSYISVAQASRSTGVSETQIRRLIAKECVNKTYEFYYNE